MGFIAKDSGGGNYKRVPSGAFIGRCYSLIDLGTQRSDGQYGIKDQHKIQIGWELFGEDDDGHHGYRNDHAWRGMPSKCHRVVRLWHECCCWGTSCFRCRD